LEVEATDLVSIGWLMAKAFPHRVIERLVVIGIATNLAAFSREVKFNP
jgi:hypothetical protein